MHFNIFMKSCNWFWNFAQNIQNRIYFIMDSANEYYARFMSLYIIKILEMTSRWPFRHWYIYSTRYPFLLTQPFQNRYIYFWMHSSCIECKSSGRCIMTIFMIPQKSGNSFFVVVRKKSFVYWNNIALGQAHGYQI